MILSYKRKLIVLLTFFFFLLSFSKIINADSDKNIYSDTTSISNDLLNSNLSISDYIKVADSDYDRTDIILATEHYDNSGNIYNYLYFYNGFKTPDNVFSISYSINGDKYISSLEYVSSSILNGIVKYKTDKDFKMSLYDNRTYEFMSFTDDESIVNNLDFTISYSVNGDSVSMKYNSYLYITNKEFITFCVPPTYLTNWYEDIAKTYWSFFKDTVIWNWFSSNGFFANGLGYIKETDLPQFSVLNFDLNKNVDKILSVSVIGDKSIGSTPYRDSIRDCMDYIIPDTDKTIVNSYTYDNPLNIKFEEKYFSYDCWGSNNFKSNYETITSPDNLITQLHMDTIEEDGWIKSNTCNTMSDYDWSVLIDFDIAKYYNKNSITSLFGQKDKKLSKVSFDDLSVVKIDYVVDEVEYTARCNSGATIDSIGVNDTPETWFDKIKEWFFDNLPTSAGIVAGIFFGLPIIASLLPSLIGIVLKLAVSIIMIPFKILESLFKKKD